MTDAPPLRPDRCETCEHWNAAHTARMVGRNGEKVVADCRARPPQLLERNGAHHASWPRLRSDQWCGAWKRRKGTGA
jgi:hypothetical protein